MVARLPLFQFLMLGFLAVVMTGCAETNFVSHFAKQTTWPGQVENKGTYKVGKSYKVGSVQYYPREDFNMSETGIASWYGPDFHGKHTANGEVYDQNEMTAAHRTLQMPSLVRVTNLENGRSVVVRINDRGPFKHGRVIDVSKRAADLLGFIGKGTARVRLEVLEKESRQIAEAAKRGMDTSRLTLTDLQKIDMNTPAPILASAAVSPNVASYSGSSMNSRGVQVASNGYSGGSDMPESLQTPTITVEELSAPGNGSGKSAQAPVWVEPKPPVQTPATTGHFDKGRFLPDAVVVREPVAAKTGLFVQAGSFGVRENATRLEATLKKIAPVIIEPIQVGGRTLYRVKLGPLSTVSEADRVLEKVISAGNGSAKVVRH